jgi:hypothetical protein
MADVNKLISILNRREMGGSGEDPKPKPTLLDVLKKTGTADYVKSGVNKTVSYLANTKLGKNVLKNIANNISPHGYRLSPINTFIDAGILNKQEEDRKEMNLRMNQGLGNMQDSLRLDLLNHYSGLPEKYNTLQKSIYYPTVGTDVNQQYYSIPKIENYIVNRASGNNKSFKNKNEIIDFIRRFKSDNTDVSESGNKIVNLPALGNATLGAGEDEKGVYISYHDIWDLNPFDNRRGSSPRALKNRSLDMSEKDNNQLLELGDYIFGDDKGATSNIGNPAHIYGRIYFDKKTGKPIVNSASSKSSTILDNPEQIKYRNQALNPFKYGLYLKNTKK